VLVALLGLAVRPAGFGNVDLLSARAISNCPLESNNLGAAVSMSCSSENPIKLGTGCHRRKFVAEPRTEVLLARIFVVIFIFDAPPSLSLSGSSFRPHRFEE
jgi:hypothetical protein